MRTAIFERQGGWCYWCGLPLGENEALHHRRLRSQGGQDTIENLVLVHHKCHNLGSRSIHLNPGQAAARGFICRAGMEPAETPLRIHGGAHIRLNADGTTTTIEENTNV